MWCCVKSGQDSKVFSYPNIVKQVWIQLIKKWTELTRDGMPRCACFDEMFTFSSGAPTNLSSTQQELHDSTLKGLCEMNEHLLCKN